jgi:hypothetical protein
MGRLLASRATQQGQAPHRAQGAPGAREKELEELLENGDELIKCI